jgi:adenine-specific DNA-methyltransferase
MPQPNYQDLSKEELLQILEKKDKELARKYGIFWDAEKIPEKVVVDCENNLPILERVKEKTINSPLEGWQTKSDGVVSENKQQPTHLLIEGDNYHALTVLNYTHKEKIDVIYIDPPYNTGNKDFVYNDRYVDKEDGYRHSKWLNFMEKRLNLAKRLLTDKGVIFISIDDNEQAQLKLLCDWIFGENNFVGDIIWNSRKSVSNDAIISLNHNHTFVYAKNIETIRLLTKKNILFKDVVNQNKFANPDNDPRGEWVADPFDAPNIRTNLMYEIVNPNTGEIFLPPNGRHWRTTKTEYERLFSENKIIFGKSGKSKPQLKRFLSDADKKGTAIKSIWDDIGTTTEGTRELELIFGEKPFNNPKPVSLIKKIIKIAGQTNSTILDFMAGSGTTGQAVLELNKEDGGNRQFILCTNNELNGVGSKLVEENLKKDKEQFGICQRVTYPRLEKVINGYNKNGDGDFVEGLCGNLQYYKTDFVKRVNNRDQIRFNLVNKCTEMLCVKEGIFEKYEEKTNYKIFISNDKKRFLCVYYNFTKFDVDQFVEEISKLDGQKQVYIFSETKEPDLEPFRQIKDCVVEAIPEPIFAIYEELIKLNK